MPNRSPARIVIVDYGTGNLNSIKRKLDRMRVDVAVSTRAGDVRGAGKIILPGVGHFDTAMRNLREHDLIDALNDAALVDQKPILGICLGMELMAKESEEGSLAGLGWLDARSVRLTRAEGSRFKVPHMGWNAIRVEKESALINGIDNRAEYYFAHSYQLELNDPSALLAVTEYGAQFPSAVQKGNIFGVQFHPEKSHDAGSRLLKNFIEM